MNFHKAGDSLYRISPYRHCFPQDNHVSNYRRSPFNFQHKHDFCDAKIYQSFNTSSYCSIWEFLLCKDQPKQEVSEAFDLSLEFLHHNTFLCVVFAQWISDSMELSTGFQNKKKHLITINRENKQKDSKGLWEQ